MKANELRLGNIVKSLNPQVDYCFIDGINQGRIDGVRRTMDGSFLSGWNHGSPELEPIILTKEWLKKFGFKDDRIMLPGDGELEIRLNGGTFHIWPTDGQTESHNYRHLIQYVHQLQNIYHALTGEELTIKEPSL